MNDNDFTKVSRYLYELSRFSIEIKRGDFYKKQYEILLDTFQNKELDEIFNTAGANIQNPFRAKKLNSKNWFKRRKFPAPAKDMRGIWTAETRYALIKGFKVGNKIDIFKRISNNRLEYGYKAKYKSKDITKYINVNLGLTDDFIEREANRIANVINEIIDNITEKYRV